VFPSTPHAGANLASWIKYLSTLLRTTVSVEELEAHHPRLRELNDWYRDQAESLSPRKKPTIGRRSLACLTTTLKRYCAKGIQQAVRPSQTSGTMMPSTVRLSQW
jgi:hypothetical protein